MIFIALVVGFVLKMLKINILRAAIYRNMDLLMSMINALQCVFHLPIMQIILQANVMSYLDIVISIVMFDPTEDITAINGLFDVFSHEDEVKDIKD